ncbi:hypothetical protein BDW72DRAFT_179207 [Aspergillus terricola var. indicus]
MAIQPMHANIISTMSSKTNFMSAGNQTQQAGNRSQTGASSKSQKDPTSGWSVEEMLETGLDQNGNIVSDDYSWIDGRRLNKGQHGGQEADDVAASLNEHFG